MKKYFWTSLVLTAVGFGVLQASAIVAIICWFAAWIAFGIGFYKALN